MTARLFVVLFIIFISGGALWSCAAAPTSPPKRAPYGSYDVAPNHHRVAPSKASKEDEAKIKAKLDDLETSLKDLRNRVNSPAQTE